MTGVTIVFETHAITTDNESGHATGWLPGRLSARGRIVAGELGVRRRDDGIAVVFVSDLERAVETARIAFTGSGIPVRQDQRLRECDYGDLNGMPMAELTRQRAQRIDRPFPDGQSYRDVVAATRDFLRDVAAGWNGSRVLVIAYSANKWALDHLLCRRPLEELVGAPARWQPGWEYALPSGWQGPGQPT